MSLHEGFTLLLTVAVIVVLAWLFTDLVKSGSVGDAQLAIVVGVFMSIINVASSIAGYVVGRKS